MRRLAALAVALVACGAPRASGPAWPKSAGTVEVTGPAEDFCLVVTQRRNVADTALVVQGERATDWLIRAQAFAGPATDGPAPRSN